MWGVVCGLGGVDCDDYGEMVMMVMVVVGMMMVVSMVMGMMVYHGSLSMGDPFVLGQGRGFFFYPRAPRAADSASSFS